MKPFEAARGAGKNTMMTARAAADRLGVTVQRVHQLRADGKLTVGMKAPGLRGASFFTVESVEQLKEERSK